MREGGREGEKEGGQDHRDHDCSSMIYSVIVSQCLSY